jgi:hypothetical protein
MRDSETHKRKKYKNYALLVVLLLVIATFFGVTIVKLQESLNAGIQPTQQ